MKKYILACTGLLLMLLATAQTDTVFWFAAPEVSIDASNFDRPIVLRITSYSQAATVSISQPAGGGMPTQNVTVPANSTQTVDITTWIDQIENKPANTTLNYGLYISSTAPVTIYYEVVSSQCQCNPEIFVLKGGNALGTDFFIPSQNYLDNNPGYSPVPYSAFDMVATQNNTTITITPVNNIVGHAAGVPFNVVLNAGQTYSATAASGLAAQHLQGSRVIANKPIAITVKDDLLNGGPFGGCSDLGGDQIVPTPLLGTEYVAMSGFLNAPGDQLFITAIQNGTSISKNGTLLTTINAGQTYQTAVGGPSAYIQTSAPAYVWQMSGIGCEIGLDQLPPIVCTGSYSVSFTRSTTEDLYANIMVRSGNQGNFLVNGVAGVITAAQFSAVPGTGGQWLNAQVLLPVASYPQNTAINVSNTSSFFHLGMIHGGPGSGTRFGYFSNFSKIEVVAQASAPNICAGSGLQLNADTIPQATYSWSGPSGFTSLQQNPYLPNTNTFNSGDYIVSATLLGCPSNADTVHVDVINCFPDSDNDGITDEWDIDDDNDGITDAIECGNGSLQNLIVNGSFEQPVISGTNVMYVDETLVPGWETTSTDNTIELWGNNFNGVPAYAGTQHAEINYTQMSALYQDVATTPGDVLVWYFAHRGRDGVDVMELRIGAPGNTQQQGQFSTGNTAWALYSGVYIVPAGQTLTRFEFQAISTASGSPAAGNFIDDVAFYSVNCTLDSDGDGIPNPLDLDSDNDGIYDCYEAGHGQADANNDGRIDGPNASFGNNGLYNGLETSDLINGTITYTVANTDNAGTYDFITLDSDGDGCYDVWEGGYADADSNGITGTAPVSVNANGVVQGANPAYNNAPTQTVAGTNDYTSTFVQLCNCITARDTNFVSICPGSSYTLPNGTSVSNTGAYSDSFTLANGCDSIFVTMLSWYAVYDTSYNAFICQGNTYTTPGGQAATTTGIYTDTLNTVNGCDSIIHVNLTVYPTYSDTVTPAICNGQTYTLPDGNTVTAAGTYTDTLSTVNGCDSIITTELTVYPTYSLTVADSICQGSTYALPGGSSATTTGTYTDTLTTVNGCDSIIITQLTVKPISVSSVYDTICNGSSYILPNGSVVTTGGIYNDTLQASNGCDSIVTTHLTVISVTLTATANNLSCFGANNGSIQAIAANGVGPYTYVLSTGGAPIGNNSTGTFTALSAANYTVDVTDTKGCTAQYNLTIQEPSALISTASYTDISCPGKQDGTLTLQATGGTPAYHYTAAGNNNTSGYFSGLAAGAYPYTVTDANGCNDTGSVTITEPQAIVLTLLPDSLILNLGSSAQVNATTNYDPSVVYSWSPVTGLSCTDCANPVVQINNSQLYQVHVTVTINGNDCEASATLPVTVIPQYDLFIPNAFTPNADGKNDVFNLFGNLQALKYLEVSIFNRIGEKVFESNDIYFNWDGTYKGKEADYGVYTYVIRVVFIDGFTPKLYKGTITLIR
ncbi:MAG: gliding motility-associated C-terminal domain-containing protein [Chitinophagales bacterium]